MTIAETPEGKTEVEEAEAEAPAEEVEVVAEVEDAPEVTEEAAPVAEEAEAETPVEEVEVVAEVEDAPEVTEEAAPVAEEASSDEDADGEEVEVVEEPPLSPFDLPGDWYVVHSYSGYENKVKLNLETRSKSMHMEDLIYEVVIPMEDVVEIKNGKKVTVPRKMFPGYILVRMYLDDDSWYAVRNTPGVTGFVGSANKPVPLSRREVERFLGVKKEEDKKAPRFKPSWEIGDSVRVQTGPFADFNGVIEDINLDQSKVVVLVNIFGRDTPVELNFEDIIKN